MMQVASQNNVNLIVTSTLSEYPTEKRFKKDLTIGELKSRLELVTGAAPATMKLELYDKRDTLVGRLDDDNSIIGSYPADDGMRLHVVGKGPRLQEADAASGIEKLMLSEEEYSKRNDTVRAYLMRNKLGKYTDQAEAGSEEAQKSFAPDEASKALEIQVGCRCEISLPGQPPKRGQVKYVGSTLFKPGAWVGIQYDEPLGKNDGSVDGHRYFECPLKYGAFVKPTCVTVGDFPEEDIGLEDEEM